jgi:hypothetical protein
MKENKEIYNIKVPNSCRNNQHKAYITTVKANFLSPTAKIRATRPGCSSVLGYASSKI